MSFFYDEIEKSVKILKKGKILLYPTDTVWGLGCDAFNIKSVKKIYEIKNRCFSKPMILLVEKIDRLSKLVENIPDFIKKIILHKNQNKRKPLTIVYNNPKKIISKFLLNKKDNTLAIRLTVDPFCSALIRCLNKPIISTSANLSGDSTPKSFEEISHSILENIDYAVNFRREETSISRNSSILKIVSNKVKILRM
ncbi:L-threonylcarbamoyladenylate synthase [Blattabacterium cuenoti]|uniref:L-threonylcarbamoyladenylate synthase n=1 Tax=Blattabacterium cuenoti TaxID=1653831 RepID=UPI00163C1D3C|nr:L-threonylcarbamoyladenylate synthase [Blattabacterium cuenoti]